MAGEVTNNGINQNILMKGAVAPVAAPKLPTGLQASVGPVAKAGVSLEANVYIAATPQDQLLAALKDKYAGKLPDNAFANKDALTAALINTNPLSINGLSLDDKNYIQGLLDMDPSAALTKLNTDSATAITATPSTVVAPPAIAAPIIPSGAGASNPAQPALDSLNDRADSLKEGTDKEGKVELTGTNAKRAETLQKKVDDLKGAKVDAESVYGSMVDQKAPEYRTVLTGKIDKEVKDKYGDAIDVTKTKEEPKTALGKTQFNEYKKDVADVFGTDDTKSADIAKDKKINIPESLNLEDGSADNILTDIGGDTDSIDNINILQNRAALLNNFEDAVWATTATGSGEQIAKITAAQNKLLAEASSIRAKIATAIDKKTEERKQKTDAINNCADGTASGKVKKEKEAMADKTAKKAEEKEKAILAAKVDGKFDGFEKGVELTIDESGVGTLKDSDKEDADLKAIKDALVAAKKHKDDIVADINLKLKDDGTEDNPGFEKELADIKARKDQNANPGKETTKTGIGGLGDNINKFVNVAKQGLGLFAQIQSLNAMNQMGQMNQMNPMMGPMSVPQPVGGGSVNVPATPKLDPTAQIAALNHDAAHSADKYIANLGAGSPFVTGQPIANLNLAKQTIYGK